MRKNQFVLSDPEKAMVTGLSVDGFAQAFVIYWLNPQLSAAMFSFRCFTAFTDKFEPKHTYHKNGVFELICVDRVTGQNACTYKLWANEDGVQIDLHVSDPQHRWDASTHEMEMSVIREPWELYG
jgi:hypothetical protein